MNEEIITMLNQIKNGVTICAVFLFFCLILVFAYYIAGMLEDIQKSKEEKKKSEYAELKKEIVEDVTSYYENSKGEQK